MGKRHNYAAFIGTVFGRLTILSMTRIERTNRPGFLCQCSCGRQHIVLANAVFRGDTTSCGCVRNEFVKTRGRQLSDPELAKKRLLARYEEDSKTGCWNWTGPTTRGGYGAFKMQQKSMAASRAAMILLRGVDPSGMFVCHTCDNPRCINPDHLFLGTPADNAADRDAKGRTKSGPSAQQRLTEEQAQFILRSSMRNVDLARRFGVSERAICDVRRGRTWRRLPRPHPSSPISTPEPAP